MAELINTIDDKKLAYAVRTGANNVIQMKDAVGKEIIIKHVLQYVTTNSSGEDVVCSNIIGSDDVIYQTLSATVSDCITSLFEIFGESGQLSEELTVEIIEKKSNKGNRFLSLELK